MRATLFTDGSCRSNPGPGGFGCLIRLNGRYKTVFGKEENTTNNRMELKAVIEGLKVLSKRKDCSTLDIVVVSDSTYITNGITKWLPTWRSNNWINSVGNEISNLDMWKELNDLLVRFRSSTGQWVKGHNNHAENEFVNQVASYESRSKDGL